MPLEYTEDKIPAFSEPAYYRIQIRGNPKQSSYGYFHGMSVKVTKHGKNLYVTVLQGQLPDQAALTGLLDMIYNMHYTVLSVEMLQNEDHK
jgi:hypothetical protein